MSTRALACRRCGKRQRVNPRSIILALAGMVLAAMFAVAGFGSRTSQGRSLEPSALAKAKAGAPTPVAAQLTASELWAAYNRDAATADRRFRDKLVAISGTLVAVPTRDFRGDIVLRLGSGDMFEAVRATLARRTGQTTASFVKGQQISLSCTGRGALIGAPILDGCTPR